MAFHHYFETMYNLANLSQTLHDASITLKEKFLTKLPDFKIPSYVEDKYQFALKFYQHKFFPLLGRELGLAF